jgi:hypothetical protein
MIKRSIKYAATLSKKAISKLDDYKGIWYEDINGYLRGKKVSPDQKTKLDGAVKAMDEATSSYTFHQPTVLWRGGVPAKAMGLKTTDINAARAKLIGYDFADPAYVSTSLNRDVGINWHNYSGAGSSEFVLRITVPPGQKAALPGVLHAKHNPDLKGTIDGEYEYILPRNTKMVVTGVFQDPVSKRVILNVKAVPTNAKIKPMVSEDLLTAAMKYKVKSSLGADDVAIPEEIAYSLKQAMDVEDGESLVQAMNRESDELIAKISDQAGVSEKELKQILEDYAIMEKQANGMTKGAYAAYTCVLKNANI